MKMNQLLWAIALLLVGEMASPLRAQQTTVTTNSFEEVKAKAEVGDAEAQLAIGSYYDNGVGVPRDQVEASKWYRKSADQGNATAQYYIGLDYEYGSGVTKDMAEAVKWYRKAAEQGFGIAQDQLGYCYAFGKGVSKDSAEAVKWYRMAAEQGNAEAQVALGNCFDFGDGVNKDYVQAYKWFYLAAARSNSVAGENISGTARALLSGMELEMTPEQIEEAKRLVRREAPEAEAKVEADIAADKRKQLEATKTNAEKGNPVDQWLLGYDYYTGTESVSKDSVEAVKWFRKAADQGYAPAQNKLGWMYGIGDGVEKDFVEAAKWYRKAAEQGIADAQYGLGVMYVLGNGVEADDIEAFKWHRKAANQGCAYAQYGLGLMYYFGKGVPQDYVEAYKWYNLAAAHGVAEAPQARNSLAARMTPEQIAEAQRRASVFVARKEVPGSNSNLDSPRAADTPTAIGTGFFITDDGYLISNHHVVKDAAQVRLVTSAGTIPAKVVQVDAANDLALLKADGRFAPLPIISSRAVKLGGTVATVGFPDPGLQGFAPKLAKGEIAALSSAGDDARYFQISAPVQPGNSGGALVDEQGNVVGIVSAKLNASAALAASGVPQSGMNYAVKSSFLLGFLESVPDVANKLKSPNTKDEKFEDVVKSAQNAAVLVLVY